MLLVFFGICAFVLMIGQLVTLARLTEHRVDIKRGESFGQGASPFWQVNIMRAANYDEAGRVILRRLKWLVIAFIASLIGILFQLARL